MCYMVTKFPKRILREMGRPIRIERIIQEFSYVKNLVKKRKYCDVPPLSKDDQS
jgi:hypothetical protein